MPPPGAGLDFRLHFVSRSPLFRGLGSDQRAEIVRLVRERRVVRRESFFLQGDPGADVFLLCAGGVKMTVVQPDGGESILRLTRPGEVFGALDVGTGGTYSAGAEALEPSHALIWDRAALDAVGDRHPVLYRNLINIMAERARALEQRCWALSFQRVSQRVASTLVRLVAEMGRPVEGGTLVGLSREELAQMTGTTLFTVSRLLSDWQERGVLATRREAVVVTDLRGLAFAGRGDKARDVGDLPSYA